MPVVGDLSVLHAIDVNCAEANLATIAFQIFETAGEMSGKAVSNNTRSNCTERDDERCCSAKNLQSLSAAVVFFERWWRKRRCWRGQQPLRYS